MPFRSSSLALSCAIRSCSYTSNIARVLDFFSHLLYADAFSTDSAGRRDESHHAVHGKIASVHTRPVHMAIPYLVAVCDTLSAAVELVSVVSVTDRPPY